jgi:DNA-binding CsgD family transcriptional regulator
VGRTDELRRLHALVGEDRHRGAILVGSAGVGKTRVALELLRAVEERGYPTARVTATRSASILPFGALAPVLPGDTRASGAVDDFAWLLHRSAADLAASAGEWRLILFVDDAHLLDEASAALLHHLAVVGSAFVLLTLRTGEPVGDAVVALWRDGLAERIELAALGDETLAGLLVGALGGPVDPVAVATLIGRAQGNAMFLRELVVGARHAGVLVVEDGHWRLRGELAPSDRLVELVESRLGHLEPPERVLLEVVAYGEPLGQAGIAAAHLLLGAEDRPPAGGRGNPTAGDVVGVGGGRDVLGLVESLERRGLLHSQMSGRRLLVRLAHPLYGEVLRARVPAIRAQAIVRSLADAVEATGARRREDPLRVASWRLTGGGGRPEVMLAGAHDARWRYDFALAERLARAAVDAGAGFDAEMLVAQLAMLQGRVEEAGAELARLADRARGDEEVGTVALSLLEIGVWSGTDVRHVADDALAVVRDDDLRDGLVAARAHVTLSCLGPRAAVEAVAPLLRRAGGRALSRACVVAGYGLGRLGRIGEAIAAAERGRAEQLATAEPMPWYPAYHDVTRCLALHHAGRFAEAEEITRANYREAVAERSVELQAIFGLFPAWCGVAERGRVLTAARRAAEVVALGRSLGRPALTRLGLVQSGLALALAGRGPEAEASLAAVEALPIAEARHDEVDLVQARAWTAVAAGDLATARRHLVAAARFGREIGDLAGAVSALHVLARLGQARDVLAELTGVAAQVEGDLAPARVAHTGALARRDADALHAVSRRFEALRADLLAAEAAADAAVVRRRAGQARGAVADERRARNLARRCEDPVTPALLGVAARATLTPSERETALLAAAGMPNRQIAGRLHLSVRTIENRLQRTYEKLGITRRTDLAGALDPEPAPVVAQGE